MDLGYAGESAARLSRSKLGECCASALLAMVVVRQRRLGKIPGCSGHGTTVGRSERAKKQGQSNGRGRSWVLSTWQLAGARA